MSMSQSTSRAIATIDFDWAGTHAVAFLGNDWIWTCPAIPALATMLNTLYGADHFHDTPGVPGMAAVLAAAAELHGTLHITPTEPAPEGVDY